MTTKNISIYVVGEVGTGKSALLGIIEDRLKDLGVSVVYDQSNDAEYERNLVDGKWEESLKGFLPIEVTLFEKGAVPKLEITQIPDTCDGLEQNAFEDKFKALGYDMSEHPLHYLFLNDRTSSAREGWREAIKYVRKLLIEALTANRQKRQERVQQESNETAMEVRSTRQYLDGKVTGWCNLSGDNHVKICEEEALLLATHVHYKGGLYRELGTATHTEDKSALTVYVHLHPHPVQLFVRPTDMFEEKLGNGQRRFTPLKPHTLSDFLGDEISDRKAVKQAIFDKYEQDPSGFSVDMDVLQMGLVEPPKGFQETPDSTDHMATLRRLVTVSPLSVTGLSDGEAMLEDAELVAAKEHVVAELVNQLRDVANQYGGTEQLRERISDLISPHFFKRV